MAKATLEIERSDFLMLRRLARRNFRTPEQELKRLVIEEALRAPTVERADRQERAEEMNRATQ